ncbi:archaea-specific SMC-related protein [Halorubellus litoreus]|uniref:Archaea-specific SMC-related protein n=1 Tax=Halorubellus litoreus TaxID=755308 RepID=A0ABD5VL99_9EURY
MESTESLAAPLSLSVENVGGIDTTSVRLEPGVTVLEGRNATNRTSFLKAVMASMGSDQYTLKGDSDAGRVELAVGDTVVERRFERRNGTVTALDDGYLDDPELADLFAFLHEDNEARQAVARGDNLHEIITRPIDTVEIEAEIERLQATKRQIDEQLERIDDRQREEAELRDRKSELESLVADAEDRLEDLEAEIEATDADLETDRESDETVERDLDSLTDKRSELEELRFELETLNETIESLEAEREAKREQRESIAVDPDTDLASLRSELKDLRDRQRRVTSQMSELQSIIQFNENMLEGTDTEIASVLRDDEGDSAPADGPLTDQLVAEETVVCWTCGSDVAEEDIEETLERLRSYRQDKFGERQSLESEIDDLQERVSSLESAEQELDDLNERLAEIDAEIDRKRTRISELEDRKATLHDEIAELEDAVEAQQSSDYSELLDLHKEANKVELELEQRNRQLASVEEELAEVESLLDEREEYAQRREQVVSELQDLRNRIDRLEDDAVDAFNEHMADVLDVLEYENLARVWIERQTRETRDGRRKALESFFELHIVRETEDGTAYEGTVETLSESEREVVGLVFALAGYLVHDVHETVPVMLLDSLEAIDAERIGRLVEYFADYPDHLVVALLPEDAAAVDVQHEVVHEI